MQKVASTENARCSFQWRQCSTAKGVQCVAVCCYRSSLLWPCPALNPGVVMRSWLNAGGSVSA